MSYGLVYLVHMISAIIFIFLLALPFWVRRLPQKPTPEVVRTIKIWRKVVLVAHLFLLLSLISGFGLYHDFTSSWLWLVLAVFLAMGAFLGIVAKSMRLTVNAASEGADYTASLSKTIRVSRLLTLSIIAMIVLMYVRW